LDGFRNHGAHRRGSNRQKELSAIHSELLFHNRSATIR
jgi:hypothetical protein